MQMVRGRASTRRLFRGSVDCSSEGNADRCKGSSDVLLSVLARFVALVQLESRRVDAIGMVTFVFIENGVGDERKNGVEMK